MKQLNLTQAALYVVASVVVAAPGDARGQAESWSERVQINAAASTSYTHDIFNPGSHPAHQSRTFDLQFGSFSLDLAEFAVTLNPEKPGDFGGKIHLMDGQSVPIGIGGGLPHLQEAYASYIFDLGTGLRVDVGTMVTHIGAEVVEGYAGFNDNFSRGLTFRYAVPFFHTGVKFSYAPSDKLAFLVMVSNGWTQNLQDNNAGKTVSCQLALSPSPAFALYLNYIGGPEKNKSNDVRHLGDVVAVVKPIDALTLTANIDLGYEYNDGATGASWFGAMLTARYDFLGNVIALRGEYLDDTFEDDLRPAFAGLGTQIVEGTLTLGRYLTDDLLIRLEGRVDHALDLDIYLKKTDGGRVATDTLATVAFNTIVRF